MLTVANNPFLLNVILLNVILLSVMAPLALIEICIFGQMQTEAGLAAAALALEDERKRRLLMKVKQKTMSAQGNSLYYKSLVPDMIDRIFPVAKSDNPDFGFVPGFRIFYRFK
jgi:hypothetical protein